MRWSSKLPIEFVLVILGKTLNCLLLLNPKLKLYTYMQSKLFKGFMSFTLIANALMIPLSIFLFPLIEPARSKLITATLYINVKINEILNK